ncbi:hypothetical protein ACHAPA_010240 [Fusarium lateritium]
MLVTIASKTQSYLLTLDTFWPVILIPLIALIYVLTVYPLTHGHLRHVPGPWYAKVSSLPLSFYDITCRRNEIVLKWHRKYGPVILIAPNEISVADLEATKEIYKATERWAKSDYFDHFTGYGLRSVFATKPYEAHREKRKYISAFYQPSTIYKLPEIEQQVKGCAGAFFNIAQTDDEIDVYAMSSWYAFDIMTFLAFGPHHRARTVSHACPERDILEGLKYQQFVGPFRHQYHRVYGYISYILKRLSSRFDYLSADDTLAVWCKDRFSAALDDPRIPDSHSLLRHLLELKQNQAKEKSIDLPYIAAEILDNITAAEATIAVTATYLIWKLTESPEWQKRIRRELSVLPRQPDGSLAFADVDSQVPSLEACIREVYRLHPSAGGKAERVVPPGGRTLAGTYLPEGTIVSTSVLALHYDEKVYPDPLNFSPERWLEGDEASHKARDAHLIPFGYGGRICLGKALATMELKMLAAALYLDHESQPSMRTNSASMKQCSTHDAVPRNLECWVRFEKVTDQLLEEHVFVDFFSL